MLMLLDLKFPIGASNGWFILSDVISLTGGLSLANGLLSYNVPLHEAIDPIFDLVFSSSFQMPSNGRPFLPFVSHKPLEQLIFFFSPLAPA